MENLLSPDAVYVQAERILNLHYLYILIDSGTKQPIPFEVLLKGTKSRTTGLVALTETLSLTDIGIAQQTLLCGDVLLPILYDVFEKGQGSSSSDQDKSIYPFANDLLKVNAVLSKNFLMYALRKEVLKKSNFINYSIALGVHDDYLLKQCSALNWNFSWKAVADQKGQDAGWSAEVGGRKYALPSSEALMDGKLDYQPDLMKMLKIRSRLIDEIASYNVLGDVTIESRISMNRLILSTF